MTHEEYQNSIEKIAEHYGKYHQQLKLFEELGELVTALSRVMQALNRIDPNDTESMFTKLENLASEIADVEIVLSQIKHLMSCHTEVEQEKARKIERQLERMKNE